MFLSQKLGLVQLVVLVMKVFLLPIESSGLQSVVCGWLELKALFCLDDPYKVFQNAFFP